jgi:hypothetical protein
MGVDSENFGANDADEQEGKPILARGWPVHVKPLTWKQQNAEHIPAVLPQPKLHDPDSCNIHSPWYIQQGKFKLLDNKKEQKGGRK